MSGDNELLVRIAADIAELRDGMAQAAAATSAGADRIKEAGGGINEIFTSIREPVAHLLEVFPVLERLKFGFEIIQSGGEVAEQLQNLSLRTGVAVEDLSRLKFAAASSGVDYKSLEVAVGSLDQKLVKLHSTAEGGVLPAAFRDLGIDPNSVRDAYDALQKLSDAFQRTGGAIRTMGSFHEILGDSGTELLPILQHLRELNTEADRLDVTLSEPTLEAARHAQDAFAMLGAEWDSIKVQIAAALEPEIGDLVKAMQDILAGVLRLAHNGDLKRWADGAVAAVEGIVTTIKTVLRALDGIGSWISDHAKDRSSGAFNNMLTPEAYTEIPELPVPESMRSGAAMRETLNGEQETPLKEVARAIGNGWDENLAAAKNAADAMIKEVTKQFELSVHDARLEGAEAGNTADAKIEAARRVFIAAQGFYGQGSKQAREAGVALTDAENARAKQTRDLAAASMADEEKLQEAGQAVARALINHDASLQLITKREAVSRRAALDEQEYQNKKALYDRLKGIYATDPRELGRVIEEEAVLNQKRAGDQIDNATRIAEANKSAAEESTGFWRDTFAPIISQFEAAFTDIVQGTRKISQAFARMVESILLEILKMNLREAMLGGQQGTLGGLIYGGGLTGLFGGILPTAPGPNAPGQGSSATGLIGRLFGPGGGSEMFASLGTSFTNTLHQMATTAGGWVAKISNILGGLAPMFGGIVKAMSSLWGSLGGAASVAGTFIASILHSQVVKEASAAAAGAFSWIMQMVPPPFSFALAPAAAAAAFAGTMALAAFDVGGVVPQDMLAQVHRGEIVVPKNFSDLLRAGDITLGGRGETHYHVNVEHHVHAIDAKSFADRIDDHSDAVATAVRKAIRDGHPIGRMGR